MPGTIIDDMHDPTPRVVVLAPKVYQFDPIALDFVTPDGQRFASAQEADQHCNPRPTITEENPNA